MITFPIERIGLSLSVCVCDIRQDKIPISAPYKHVTYYIHLGKGGWGNVDKI